MTKKTLVLFILDESGSMEAVQNESVEGLNKYIETLQNDDTSTVLKLVTFNTNNPGYKTLINNEDVMKVKPIPATSYYPSGLTPLLDAIARGILETDDYIEWANEEINVMVTIMTDGMENASRFFSYAQVSEMIEERERKGWIFTYLGSKQNSYRESAKIGIKRKFAQNYEYNNPKEAMRVMAESTIRSKKGWRKSREEMDYFTDAEKLRLMRKKVS